MRDNRLVSLYFTIGDGSEAGLAKQIALDVAKGLLVHIVTTKKGNVLQPDEPQHVHYTPVKQLQDEDFAENLLPGKLESASMVQTDMFPLWKSLSLDRFRFFAYDIELTHRLLSKMLGKTQGVASVYLDTSPHNPFVGLAANLSTKYKCNLQFLRTDDILTAEFYNLWIYLDKPVVHSPFVEDNLVYNNGASKFKTPLPRVGGQGANHLSAQIGMVYNKEDDWQFSKYSITKQHDFVVALDHRSYTLYQTLYNTVPCYTIDNLPFVAVSDLYMHRFHTSVFSRTNVPTKLHVVDVLQRNGVQEMFERGFASQSCDVIEFTSWKGE